MLFSVIQKDFLKAMRARDKHDYPISDEVITENHRRALDHHFDNWMTLGNE